MGIAEPSAIGKVKGKVGNVIFYEVDGQLRVRSAPGQVRDPKTPAQLAQRGRVRGIADLYAELDYQLHVYWKELTEGTTMNAYNLFMSRNIRCLDKEGKIAEPGRFLVCAGDLPLPAKVEAKAAETGDRRVEIRWDPKVEEWQAREDRFQIAVYLPEEKRRKIRVQEETAVRRRDGHYVWTLPTDVKGPIYAYGFFRGRYKSEVSDSFFLGVFGGQE